MPNGLSSDSSSQQDWEFCHEIRPKKLDKPEACQMRTGWSQQQVDGFKNLHLSESILLTSQNQNKVKEPKK